MNGPTSAAAWTPQKGMLFTLSWFRTDIRGSLVDGMSDRGHGSVRSTWHAVVMPVLTRRWNDPRKAGDGFRLLVCRYRPRGLPKGAETWDAWSKELAPSTELIADFHGKNGPPITWAEFRRRYLAEMRGQRERVADVARKVAAGRTVTLLCSSACVDETRCHRTLLAGLIAEPGAAR